MADEEQPVWDADLDEPDLDPVAASGFGRDQARPSRSLSTELVALAREQYVVLRGTDAQTYAVGAEASATSSSPNSRGVQVIAGSGGIPTIVLSADQ